MYGSDFICYGGSCRKCDGCFIPQNKLEKTLSQNIADLRESINDLEFELSEKINDLKVEMSLSKVGISLKEWYGARSQSQCAKQDQESGESKNAQCVRGELESGENVGNTGVTKNSSILR